MIVNYCLTPLNYIDYNHILFSPRPCSCKGPRLPPLETPNPITQAPSPPEHTTSCEQNYINCWVRQVSYIEFKWNLLLKLLVAIVIQRSLKVGVYSFPVSNRCLDRLTCFWCCKLFWVMDSRISLSFRHSVCVTSSSPQTYWNCLQSQG